ncbi:MAG: TolC family protein [Pseudomonadota bacterium]
MRRILMVASLAIALNAEAQPPLADGTPLTLMEAVELSLRANPNLRITEFNVDVQAGFLQQQSGQFDQALGFNASVEYREETLTNAARQGQIDNRQNIQTAADSFAERATTQRIFLAELIEAQENPDDISFSDPNAQNQIDLINALIDTAPDAASRTELEALRADFLERRRNEVQDSIDELLSNEAAERERLEKLGGVPDTEESLFTSVDVSYRIPYRNGNVATFFAELTQNGGNFKGKPRDPSFGGRGTIDLYRSRVGVRLDLPFGQGSGRAAVAAFEESAALGLDAAKFRLTQQASNVVAATANAYWSLVAAQMRRDVLARSANRQARLLSLVDILIEADLLPAIERGRALAQQADAQASLVAAENTLRAAKLALADQIGLQVDDESLAPAAADAFPAVAELESLKDLPVSDLIVQALEDRGDRLAAELDVDSARVLEEAAKLEQRRRHDVSVEIFGTGVSETSDVPQGIADAFFDDPVYPSARLSYSYSRPMNNDAAVGQFRQAQAQRQQSVIGAEDLARRIRTSVIQSSAALADASQQAAFADEAMRLFQEAVLNERDKVELGTATVIDLILTEERLTIAELSVVGARQRYANELIGLRFATATLVASEEEGYAVEAPALVSVPEPAER